MTTLPGSERITSLIGTGKITFDNGGAEVASLPVTGGTFIANGVTPVVVADANVDAGSNILITLNTPGGTVGALPVVQTKTAGTGFTILGTALDTSVYNYLILA